MSVTQADAVKAAKVYKATQPALDAVKETIAQNDRAKKVLGEYMVEHDMDVFRGVTLKLVPFDGWDSDKLHDHLGAKVGDFRKTSKRKYFGLARRSK